MTSKWWFSCAVPTWVDELMDHDVLMLWTEWNFA